MGWVGYLNPKVSYLNAENKYFNPYKVFVTIPEVSHFTSMMALRQLSQSKGILLKC
jgi:hypothetical protein